MKSTIERFSLIVFLLVISIMIIGCTQTDSLDAKNTKAICGNGVVEPGETAENCCADIPCADSYECKNQIADGKTSYFCKRLAKEETYELKKFKSYDESNTLETQKTETSLIDWGTIGVRFSSMDELLSQLNTKGYDISIDREYLKHRQRRTALLHLDLSNTDALNSIDSNTQLTAINEVLSAYTKELQILNSINESTKQALDKSYQYDFTDKLVYANTRIKELELLKSRSEKGINATLSVSDYTSTCYGKTGYLSDVKIGTTNTGGFTIEEPKVDLLLMKDNAIVSKETDAYLAYELLPEKIIYTNVGGVGLMDNLGCGTYDLKVVLRSGANPKVIATTIVKVNIK